MVKAEGFVFRSANNAEDHHNGGRFFDFLVLGDDGRIRLDYQFLDRRPAP